VPVCVYFRLPQRVAWWQKLINLEDSRMPRPFRVRAIPPSAQSPVRLLALTFTAIRSVSSIAHAHESVTASAHPHSEITSIEDGVLHVQCRSSGLHPPKKCRACANTNTSRPLFSAKIVQCRVNVRPRRRLRLESRRIVDPHPRPCRVRHTAGARHNPSGRPSHRPPPACDTSTCLIHHRILPFPSDFLADRPAVSVTAQPLLRRMI
jgi:hypothetical protein